MEEMDKQELVKRTIVDLDVEISRLQETRERYLDDLSRIQLIGGVIVSAKLAEDEKLDVDNNLHLEHIDVRKDGRFYHLEQDYGNIRVLTSMNCPACHGSGLIATTDKDEQGEPVTIPCPVCSPAYVGLSTELCEPRFTVPVGHPTVVTGINGEELKQLARIYRFIGQEMDTTEFIKGELKEPLEAIQRILHRPGVRLDSEPISRFRNALKQIIERMDEILESDRESQEVEDDMRDLLAIARSAMESDDFPEDDIRFITKIKLLDLIASLRTGTSPAEDHEDSGSIEDCWNELTETVEAL